MTKFIYCDIINEVKEAIMTIEVSDRCLEVIKELSKIINKPEDETIYQFLRQELLEIKLGKMVG